ncbi:MAG TPA: ABC transporter permease [Aggregatilineaceae bacterium]|nr:ABC transporter permease [Aggregatilineaceae bacterium]
MQRTTPVSRPERLTAEVTLDPAAHHVRQIARDLLKRFLNFALAIGIFLLCWIALAYYLDRYYLDRDKMPFNIMPYPWQVWPVFVEEMRGPLYDHLIASTERVLKAIVVAVLVATPVGLGLGQIRVLNRIFGPLIALVHPIPKIVFLPVILAVLGVEEKSKIFLISLILFFQILVVVRDEAASIRPELIQSVRSLGAGRRALFRYVYLPASLPAVLTALRISIGTAIAVLFIAEQYATKEGLGYYIVTKTWQRLRFEEMYAGILAMSLLGLALYSIVDILERIVGRWRHAGEA